MEAGAAEAGWTRSLTAFRSRDFRLLWAGQSISLIGDGAFLVAMGWRVVMLTGKSSSLAILLALQAIAMLTTLLIGGALADRYPRRLLMIVSDLARAAVVAVLAFADASGQLTFQLWLVIGVLYGLADGFFYPAFGGIVPLVVEDRQVASANALLGVSRNLSFVVGPALAGVVYGAAGSTTVFALNGASFVVSAALLVLARPRGFEREPHEGTWQSIVEGGRYVAGVPWLWITISLAGVGIMFAWAPFQTLLPRFVQTHYHAGVGAYGTVFSMQAVGMVIGAVLFGQFTPTRHRVVITYAGYAVNDVCVILMALLPWYGLGLALVGLRGLLLGFSNALWETVLIQLVPESKLSRVTSLDFLGTLGLTPVGYALVAVASPYLGPSTILVIGFSGALLLWSLPLTLARVRSAA